MTFHRIGVSLALLLSSLLAVAGELPVDKIRLPEGFSIEVLARVPNARQVALGDSNVLYVVGPAKRQRRPRAGGFHRKFTPRNPREIKLMGMET
jgi:hypothetical protein